MRPAQRPRAATSGRSPTGTRPPARDRDQRDRRDAGARGRCSASATCNDSDLFVHLHALATDGCFESSDEGEPRFRRVKGFSEGHLVRTMRRLHADTAGDSDHDEGGDGPSTSRSASHTEFRQSLRTRGTSGERPILSELGTGRAFLGDVLSGTLWRHRHEARLSKSIDTFAELLGSEAGKVGPEVLDRR